MLLSTGDCNPTVLKPIFSVSLACWLGLSAPWVCAQAEQPQAAAKQALIFESAMKTYQPFKEQPLGSWAEFNQEAYRFGGWKAYARDIHRARQAEKPADSGKRASP